MFEGVASKRIYDGRLVLAEANTWSRHGVPGWEALVESSSNWPIPGLLARRPDWPLEICAGFPRWESACIVDSSGGGAFDSAAWFEANGPRTSTGVATVLRGCATAPARQPEIRLNRRARRAARPYGTRRITAAAAPPRVAAAPRPAAGSSSRRFWPSADAQPPGFTVLPSTTAFGPPIDISMGWDGTLWAIDQEGAPHLYDPTEQQWQLQGAGIDAAAVVPDNTESGSTCYLFRGSEFVTTLTEVPFLTVLTAPKAIAEQWPDLPSTFKMGVVGATWASGPSGKQSLVLFNGGRYVSTEPGADPPAKLTDLTGWPWKDGVIEGVFGRVADTVILLRGGEAIEVDLVTKSVTKAPQPFSQAFPFYDDSVLPWASGAVVDAIALFPLGHNIFVFKGASVLITFDEPKDDTSLDSTSFFNYMGNVIDVPEWYPCLLHAPSGRVGDLWSVIIDENYVVRHNGEQWGKQSYQADNVSAGQDGTVMIASAEGIWKRSGDSVTKLGSLPSLIQVAVGNADTVWGRTTDNEIYRFDGQTFTKEQVLNAATHMAANADGTLWHCNEKDPNAYRFISEASTVLPATLPIADSVTGIHKVASTGFGTAYCLAQHSDSTQAYQYNSPYVFKTSDSYAVAKPIVRGLGNIYFVSDDDIQNVIVALDAHTGREVSRSQGTPASQPYHGLVFDPLNELVYVTRDNTAGQPGLEALNARDLHEVIWGFSAAGQIGGSPALNGTQLCVSDDQSNLYMLNTRHALALTSRHEGVSAGWTYNFASSVTPPSVTPPSYCATPVFANGWVYAAMWAVPLESATLYLAQCRAEDGSLPQLKKVAENVAVIDSLGSVPSPDLTTSTALGRVCAEDKNKNKSEPMAVYINSGKSIYVVNIDTDAAPLNGSFTLPTGWIYTGLAYDNGSRVGQGLDATPDFSKIRIWFGDTEGNLWALDDTLVPVDGTPHGMKSTNDFTPHIIATPAIYKDPQGGRFVLFGLMDWGPSPALWVYDPVNSNAGPISTGTTSINYITGSAESSSLFYAGGGGNQFGVQQVFGIRVEDLARALASFVIESQMMQDPDPSKDGGNTRPQGQIPDNPIPPSAARYQTHLTVVDNLDASAADDQPKKLLPRPNVPIKVWADRPNTIVTIGTATGPQQFTIGPGDDEYAAVATGADGSLVIVSEAKDMFASPLRVWASFMDLYERIIVNPDQEFHARVTTAHATTDQSDPDFDDPDKVNLATAHNYNGVPLFNDDQKAQNQPQNCATAVGQMNNGVGLSHGASKASYANLLRVMRGERPAAAAALRAAESGPEKYLAYPDLTGASHFPTNIPAKRPVGIVAPAGIRFYRDENKVATLAVLSHSAARDRIDDLTGPAFVPPSQPAASFQPLSVWSDFWNWLVESVHEIEEVVVSVAEDVVVGIKLAEGVFRAIINTVEDIASAIGSFFKMLIEKIEDIIAALSWLFHFGEILKTQGYLENLIKPRIQLLTQAATSKTAKGTGQIIDGFTALFKDAETIIREAFDKLSSNSAFASPGSNNISGPISGYKGMGGTAHTAFTAGRQGTGQSSSHAPQCSWGTQKLKLDLPAGSNTTGALSRDVSGIETSGLTGVLEVFFNRIQGGNLSDVFSKFQTDAKQSFTASSAQQFFSTLGKTLLDLIELVLLGALSVGQALVDTMLGAIEDVIAFLSSILYSSIAIDMPFVGWLYKTLTGQEPTYLSVITLLAAIPVTIIYRVVEGRYPSQDLPSLSDKQVGTPPPIIQRMLGALTAMLSIFAGVVNAVGDSSEEAPPYIAKLSLALGVLIELSTFPDINNISVSTWDWAAYGIGFVLVALGIFGLADLSGAAKAKVLVPVVTSLTAAYALAATIVAFVKDGSVDAKSDVEFAAGLIVTFPGLLQPVKLVGGNEAVQVADVLVGFAAAILDFLVAWGTFDDDSVVVSS